MTIHALGRKAGSKVSVINDLCFVSNVALRVNPLNSSNPNPKRTRLHRRSFLMQI